LAYRARGDEKHTDVARGLKLAIACGILMGVFYPLVTKSMLGAGGLGPYSVSFVFSLGVFVSSFLFNTWLMRRPITDDPPCHFARYRAAGAVTHLAGIAGGAIWGVGMTFSLVAATTHFVGTAVASPIDRVKPKESTTLARLRNLDREPTATLLCEHWDPRDWSALWWVRALLVRRTPSAVANQLIVDSEVALREKYAQYRESDLPFDGVIVFDVRRVTGWSA